MRNVTIYTKLEQIFKYIHALNCAFVFKLDKKKVMI